jgi:hypothetical protein
VAFADPVTERKIGPVWRKGFPRPAAPEAIVEAVRV